MPRNHIGWGGRVDEFQHVEKTRIVSVVVVAVAFRIGRIMSRCCADLLRNIPHFVEVLLPQASLLPSFQCRGVLLVANYQKIMQWITHFSQVVRKFRGKI